MPPRAIKVVNMHEEQPESKEEEPVQQQEAQPYEEEAVEEPQEEHPETSNDIDSEDLDNLVKQYTKERKQKKKAVEVKSECQHCGKSMSAKSLKYSHVKNCKSNPINQPPPPRPPSPEPEPKAKPKSKVRPPRKTINKKKPSSDTEVQFEIQEPTAKEVEQPFTTNYLKLVELQKSARTQQKQQRMKSLASQAF